MRILFTKSNKFLSRLIISATGEGVSHVALEFPSLGIVVHSNLLGVHLEWAENFKKNCNIVHTLEALDSSQDFDKLSILLTKHEWAPYDFGALFFVGLSLTLRKYFKIPLPKSNLWQSSGMFLCTEWTQTVLNLPNDPMITPQGLYNYLKCQNKWK